MSILQNEKNRLLRYALSFGRTPNGDSLWLVHGEDAVPALESLVQDGLVEMEEGRGWRLIPPNDGDDDNDPNIV